jgi:hypothetical protein
MDGFDDDCSSSLSFSQVLIRQCSEDESFNDDDREPVEEGEALEQLLRAAVAHALSLCAFQDSEVDRILEANSCW